MHINFVGYTGNFLLELCGNFMHVGWRGKKTIQSGKIAGCLTACKFKTHLTDGSRICEC